MMKVLSRAIAVIGMVFMFNPLQAQQYDWENPAVFKINNEKPHSTLIPFPDVSSALSFDRTKSSFFKILNGTWKFKWIKTPLLAPDNFFKTEYSVANWDNISVPGNWQLQGKYDRPIFINIKHPFPAIPPMSFPLFSDKE